MTSPIVNEDMMLHFLRGDRTPANATRLSNGAALMLLDAFDRKVTRDQFIAAAGAALGLADACGRMALCNNIRDHAQLNDDKASLVDLEIALKATLGLVNNATNECTKMAHLLCQCAKDEDAVH